ncbi:hypothetical protein DFS34DRAFT_683532 [Phlyctochytrium arcticum]|nr:hypothetical protein DFS34DRAFT_683532 [Phlyctochytrium arcticum]
MSVSGPPRTPSRQHAGLPPKYPSTSPTGSNRSQKTPSPTAASRVKQSPPSSHPIPPPQAGPPPSNFPAYAGNGGQQQPQNHQQFQQHVGQQRTQNQQQPQYHQRFQQPVGQPYTQNHQQQPYGGQQQAQDHQQFQQYEVQQFGNEQQSQSQNTVATSHPEGSGYGSYSGGYGNSSDADTKEQGMTDDNGFGLTSSYADHFLTQPPYLPEQNNENAQPTPDQDDIVVQQDAAIGLSSNGRDTPAVKQLSPRVIARAHAPFIKTVSSGAGPSYVPDSTTDQSGGVYRINPVRTRISASYRWSLDGFSSAMEDKLVSLPFGPSNWRWQLVVYPRGVGAGAGTHVSSYIRPLQNETELAAGDDWTRPISSFTTRVRRAIPGSPTVGGREPDEEFLVTETALPNFDGFSKSMPGWGFPELLSLQTLSEAVTYDGTLVLDATIDGEQTIDWAVYQYQWDIPSFRQLTEDEILSQPFGPPDCQWKVRIHRHGTKTGQSSHFSSYLVPEKSPKEVALGSAWTRPITALTLQIITDSRSASPLVSKTLTGGFIYADSSDAAGWDQLVDLDSLNQSLDWYGTLSLRVVVQWDPTFGKPGTFLGNVQETLVHTSGDTQTTTNQLEMIKQELDQAREESANVGAELAAAHSEVSTAQSELAETRQQLEEVSSRLQTMENIEARMAVVQKELMEAQGRIEEAELVEEKFQVAKQELALAREEQHHADENAAKLKRVRAHLSTLRANMEDNPPAELANGADPLFSSTADANENEDKEDLRAELLRAKAHVASLEADLAEARAEINDKDRALHDASLQLSTPTEYINGRLSTSNSSDGGSNDPVAEAVSNLRNEILVVKGILLEAEARELDDEGDRAGLSAELAMAGAELELTRAAFLDIVGSGEDFGEAEREGQVVNIGDEGLLRSEDYNGQHRRSCTSSTASALPDLMKLQQDLLNVRVALLKKRLELEASPALAIQITETAATLAGLMVYNGAPPTVAPTDSAMMQIQDASQLPTSLQESQPGPGRSTSANRRARRASVLSHVSQTSAVDLGMISVQDSREAVPLPSGMAPPPMSSQFQNQNSYHLGQPPPPPQSFSQSSTRSPLLAANTYAPNTDSSHEQKDKQLQEVSEELGDLNARMETVRRMLSGHQNSGDLEQRIYATLFENRRPSLTPLIAFSSAPPESATTQPPPPPSSTFHGKNADEKPGTWTPVEAGDPLTSPDLAARLKQVQAAQKKPRSTIKKLFSALLLIGSALFFVLLAMYMVPAKDVVPGVPEPLAAPSMDIARPLVPKPELLTPIMDVAPPLVPDPDVAPLSVPDPDVAPPSVSEPEPLAPPVMDVYPPLVPETEPLAPSLEAVSPPLVPVPDPEPSVTSVVPPPPIVPEPLATL